MYIDVYDLITQSSETVSHNSINSVNQASHISISGEVGTEAGSFCPVKPLYFALILSESYLSWDLCAGELLYALYWN